MKEMIVSGTVILLALVVVTFACCTQKKNSLAEDGKADELYPGSKGWQPLSGYDNIFIGGPIWWGRPPYIIRTFLEAHPELDGKTIIPFGTHAGSGVSSYTALMCEYFPNATLLEALGISGATAQNDVSSTRTFVESWLKKIGLDKELTSIRRVRTRASDTGKAYRLNGTPANGEHGVYIKNGKKYIER